MKIKTSFIRAIFVCCFVCFCFVKGSNAFEQEEMRSYVVASNSEISNSNVKYKVVPALLKPKKHTVLSSQINGKITSFKVKEGDYFNKSEILVRLDCSIQWARLAKAKAELEAAQDILKSQKKLRSYSSGSELELKRAEHNVKKAKADVRISNVAASMCKVKAPYSGYVVDKKADNYQSVSSGQELLEIIDTNVPEIHIIAPSSWLAWVEIGDTFRIKISENQEVYKAKIVKIAKKIDPASQTVKLYGNFLGAPENLVSGMSGKASFTVKEETK
jgi:RND family efflux transporter MFP subunit